MLATGEGAAPSLEDIAIAGTRSLLPRHRSAAGAADHGRGSGDRQPRLHHRGRVPPRDHRRRPSSPNGSTVAPALLGYVATTAKGTSTTLLRIGPDRDPLLATWQAGLGRVSSWTSDASAAWSQHWATWDGYVDFWTDVVKDTFPAGDTAGAVRASVSNGRLSIVLDSGTELPDGATATAVVAGPDGQRTEIALERTGEGELTAEVAATRPGSYAVGVSVTGRRRDAALVDQPGERELPAGVPAGRCRPGPARTDLGAHRRPGRDQRRRGVRRRRAPRRHLAARPAVHLAADRRAGLADRRAALPPVAARRLGRRGGLGCARSRPPDPRVAAVDRAEGSDQSGCSADPTGAGTGRRDRSPGGTAGPATGSTA